MIDGTLFCLFIWNVKNFQVEQEFIHHKYYYEIQNKASLNLNITP